MDKDDVEHQQIAPAMWLPDELLLDLFRYVPPLDLLRSVTFVSKKYAEAVRNERLWRIDDVDVDDDDDGASDQRRGTQGSSIKSSASTKKKIAMPRQPLTLHQMRLRSLFDYSRLKGSSLSYSVPSFLQPTSILPTRELATSIMSSNVHHRVCLATSTDHEYERIENVLAPSSSSSSNVNTNNNVDVDDWENDILSGYQSRNILELIFMRGETYWSSVSSQSGHVEDTNEVLFFTTNCPLALISDVAIKPFTERRFLGGSDDVTYTWPGLALRVYRLGVGVGGVLNDEDDDGSSSSVGRAGVGAANQNGHTQGGATPPPVIDVPCVVSDPTPADNLTHMEEEENDDNNDDDQPTYPNKPKRHLINTLLTGHKPVYEIQINELSTPPGSSIWQHYPIPPNVIGNVITLTLLGKHYRQVPTSGYYVCVDRVAARGIPLATHPPTTEEDAVVRGPLDPDDDPNAFF